MAQFRAKARAVELLGKGQIADLPTAITELWKNGYDAYAKNLECKLFLETYKDAEKPLFLLSDDGIGMSENDILNRWFVLGTDSKARGQVLEPKFGLDRRVPMGEKGIGRLSVSYLGSQMLMLTKKANKPSTALLLDWRVLDNYDFFLEDLNIPVFPFDSTEGFRTSFSNAKNEFEENLKEEKWHEQADYQKLIKSEWTNLNLPKFLEEEVLEKFTQDAYHGTTFLIFTPHDQLLELSDKDRVDLKKDASLNYLRTSLSGLHNDLKEADKDFETRFLIYDNVGKYDLIDDFFTREEMRSADHWLKGSFDENGFFTGEIRVYNKREKYSFRPNRPPGKTSYGSFNIEWGSVEGHLSSSTLNEEQYHNLNSKLEHFGGLYIYRDNFRVLPYGRPEFDFLQFEKRRAAGAGYYFFSHRRFIGYIDLKRDKNHNLKDKAGREGFIQNKAYRDFTDDLIEFFVDIAKRYMRKSGSDEDPTFRESQLEDIKSKYEQQLVAAKRKNAKTKKAFLEKLKASQNEIQSFQGEIANLTKKLDETTSQIQINYNDYNRILEELENKKTQLRELKVQRPQGVNITESQKRQLETYQKEYYLVQEKVNTCVRLVESTRERINVENLKLEFNDRFRSHEKYLDRLFSNYQANLKIAFDRLSSSLEDEKEAQKTHFIEQSSPFRLTASEEKEDVQYKISGLIKLIEEQIQSIENSISGFMNHVTNLQIDVDDDFLRGWYQEQNEKLENKLSDYEELAQVGISIEIIDHQFNVLYSQMNDAIGELDQIAKKDYQLTDLYRRLKGAFQHLEGNYKLLRPLYKSSRRTRETITGQQLEEYIRSFFKNDFERSEINFDVSNSFKDFEFFSFESIIKPVFLNIINNAIYWLTPAHKRVIRIEVQNAMILIMNSGERIDDSYLEDIFTLFFSRKREGRGIGLYLARKNLKTVGYNIHATNDPKLNQLGGACFIIKKNEN